MMDKLMDRIIVLEDENEALKKRIKELERTNATARAIIRRHRGFIPPEGGGDE